MKTHRFLAAVLLLVSLTGCGGRQLDAASGTTEDQPGVTISFNFQKQSGYASNQFAVWIEDADGNFIKTLYATKFTASGGYKNRPDSIPVWVEKSGLSDSKNVDAVTGATPKSGALSYT